MINVRCRNIPVILRQASATSPSAGRKGVEPLKKAQELVGMAVVEQQTGKQLGVVRDVYFDASWRLQGLIIENKGLFRHGRCIPLDKLSIGEDAIMVDGETDVHDLPNGVYTLYSGENKLAGKPVMTKAGDGLGQIHDVYFLEEMGNLIGCELSDGLLSDLRNGRKVVPWSREVTVGEDVIFLPEEPAAEEAATEGQSVSQGVFGEE